MEFPLGIVRRIITVNAYLKLFMAGLGAGKAMDL
jgi:hypothetical protein